MPKKKKLTRIERYERAHWIEIWNGEKIVMRNTLSNLRAVNELFGAKDSKVIILQLRGLATFKSSGE